jgi:hypothetical protein
MPLITLMEQERLDLAALLSELQDVCQGNGPDPVAWEELGARVQAMRLRLFEEE